MSHNVSHGRGGAANIRPDDTPYADGEIVREGPVGDQGDGPFSSGRGGQGNIGGENQTAGTQPHDAEIVPETAMRVHKEESHHVGRGGAGNEMHVHNKKEKEKEKVGQYGFQKEVPEDSLKDKIKHLLHSKKNED